MFSSGAEARAHSASRFAAGIMFSSGKEPRQIVEKWYLFEEAAYKGDKQEVESYIAQVQAQEKLNAEFKQAEYAGCALYYAAQGHHISIMILLLQAGVRTNVYVNNTLTLEYLCQFEEYHEELTAYLKHTEVSVELLQSVFLVAAFNNNVNALSVLLEHNQELLNGHNKRGLTALMGAAAFSSQAAVEFLFAAGAKIEMQNQQGWTAIDFAFARVPLGFIASKEDETKKRAIENILLTKLKLFFDEIKAAVSAKLEDSTNVVLDYYFSAATRVPKEEISENSFLENSQVLQKRLQLFYFEYKFAKAPVVPPEQGAPEVRVSDQVPLQASPVQKAEI